MAGDRTASILQHLKDRGIRITVDRRLVVEAMVRAGDHVTAEELSEMLHLAHPDLHAATVYRTLELLEDTGLAYHVHLGHGPARWHLGDPSHLHLACERCGEVEEVDDNLLETVKSQLLAATGFKIDTHHFALVGRCSRCLAQEQLNQVT
ncbi:MAG: transcriptional repressor [Actinobacteria bacterium]|jgi:Fur family ferric uptake transcriptional regulator|nr:transcriptional repressor [Actinomycetota bacterium]MCL6095397.1 transcriptional repressor [Actinomycetota bacterium]